MVYRAEKEERDQIRSKTKWIKWKRGGGQVEEIS